MWIPMKYSHHFGQLQKGINKQMSLFSAFEKQYKYPSNRPLTTLCESWITALELMEYRITEMW